MPSFADPNCAGAAVRGLVAWNARVQRDTDKVVLAGALVLERAIKDMLSRAGTGRTWYIRRAGGFTAGNRYQQFGGKWGFKVSVGRGRVTGGATGGRYWSPNPPGIPHVASAPGQPPAVDTGQLRASIGHEVTARAVRVGTGLVKAVGLEFGTATLRPRPFMRPALRAARKAMTEQLRVELVTRRGAVA